MNESSLLHTRVECTCTDGTVLLHLLQYLYCQKMLIYSDKHRFLTLNRLECAKKVKMALQQAMKTRALDGGGWSTPLPGRFSSGKKVPIVGLKAGLKG
jgi:hypothetical protein